MAPSPIGLLVHATHEAGLKLGGIGAVLDGLLTAPSYLEAVGRTILVGPINPWNHVEMERLTAPANGLRVIYSTFSGMEWDQAPAELAQELRAIEARMNVRFLYGVRSFGATEHEILLVDAGAISADTINSYKFYLWQHWGLDCARYEGNWEFSFYLNAGEPLYAGVSAITGDLAPGASRYVVAHEWMGLPLVFSTLLHGDTGFRSVFYAHEVATARLLVEGHAGHDVRFYNALRLGLQQGQNLDRVFGDQSWYYKHAMILRAGVCDRLLAVGDPVVDELRFLGGVYASAPIDLVYNGIPAPVVTLDQRLASRELLLRYAENLYGTRPDYVFSHVTRMVTSKALWRDIRVLEHLEWTLAAEGRSVAVFLVTTAAPAGRRSEDVYRWEAEYGWPVGHRADNGDLLDDEVQFYFNLLEPFHWGRQSTHVCLVNQFGWDRSRCGWRMPGEMRFSDLRNGSDLEFGQSIYEPFGIAQVEPLAAGALCVPSTVCGCLGFAGRAARGPLPTNLVVADYVSIPETWQMWSPWDALRIDRSVRESIEGRESWRIAQEVARRLPRDDQDRRRLLAQGQALAAGMSWEVVARDYFLPALARTR